MKEAYPVPPQQAQAQAQAQALALALAQEQATAVYACCASESNAAAWQCNWPCRLWFHNLEDCMKEKGDSANPLCEGCLTAAMEAAASEEPRAKRVRAPA